MWNLENNSVWGDPYYKYSRFIASWVNMHHKHKLPVYFNDQFEDWLRSIEVPEADVHDIIEMATCGKLELETSADNWIKEHNQ